MKAKTQQAIIQHGKSILAAFPSATEKNPLALAKKLRRIEVSISKWTLENCNVGVPENKMYEACEKHLERAKKLLGLTNEEANEVGLFINTDPRGYALKISDEWVREYNKNVELRIFSDCGGYGILAPEFK